MTDEKNIDEQDGSVLPAREVMTLISPGAGSLPGVSGLLGGAAPDPNATPAAGAGDLASGTAAHAADGHAADSPHVSDQPQSLSTSSSHSASSET